MRQRPLMILVCAMMLLYFPLETLWWWFRSGELTRADILISILFPLGLLYPLIRVTKVGWFTLVAMIGIWGVRDLQSYYSQDQSLIPLLVHIGIYAFSMTYFINPRIRHLYFDPKLRWWRTKPRFETHLPLVVNRAERYQYPVLRNISEGGCFIETAHLADINDKVHVAIPLPVPLTVSVIRSEGQVRWVSKDPKCSGMGIQFKDPLPKHVKALKEYVQKQI